jgi:ABC-type Fe3+ transport system substrate-binding protein
MNLSRRSFGIGILAASAVATGGYLALKDTPFLSAGTALTGFVGGEKKGFLANPQTISALRSNGFTLTGRQAGSVEMVREPTLLQQNPQFLWPSSSVMVQIARDNGVAVRKQEVVLNSPLVIYSWETVADSLAKTGIVKAAADGTRTIDLTAYLRAIIAGKAWADLGVADLFGVARVVSTDPNLSNSGFMFAGLVANLLSSNVATQESLATAGDDTLTVFKRMGFKSNSSGSLFEDYISGGVGAYPMVVLYENQLIEWALTDSARWQRVMSGKSKPVMLYPTPTVYSAHPLISLKPEADGLIEAMLSKELQDIAWHNHGFRGILGAPGAALDPSLPHVPERLDAIVPMPDAGVMLKLLQMLTG